MYIGYCTPKDSVQKQEYFFSIVFHHFAYQYGSINLDIFHDGLSVLSQPNTNTTITLTTKHSTASDNPVQVLEVTLFSPGGAVIKQSGTLGLKWLYCKTTNVHGDKSWRFRKNVCRYLNSQISSSF